MIYFVQNRTEPLRCIKIGTTKRLTMRLSQLRKALRDDDGTPPDLVVLGVMNGSFAVEKLLHRKFDAEADGSEWFMPSVDLLEFIQRECEPWDGVDEAISTDVRLRMDAELAERIQKAADQEGNSVAAFIRAAVVKELKRRERDGAE